MIFRNIKLIKEYKGLINRLTCIKDKKCKWSKKKMESVNKMLNVIELAKENREHVFINDKKWAIESIFEDSDKILKENNEIEKFIDDNIKDSDSRFLLIPLGINYVDYSSHANIIIIDKDKKEIFHFEPYIETRGTKQLVEFIRQLTTKDLFDAQERYDLLFDRGRALSLLLFEHVHGESRDRGQAMVDLMNVYKSNGFEVNSSQLPDYIPLYLEFLSEQTPEFIQEWLGDICHIMTMLSERLIDRKCDYSVLFDSLIEVSGVEVDRKEIAEAVSKEVRDDTVEAIDKEWEDKEIWGNILWPNIRHRLSLDRSCFS